MQNTGWFSQHFICCVFSLKCLSLSIVWLVCRSSIGWRFIWENGPVKCQIFNIKHCQPQWLMSWKYFKKYFASGLTAMPRKATWNLYSVSSFWDLANSACAYPSCHVPLLFFLQTYSLKRRALRANRHRKGQRGLLCYNFKLEVGFSQCNFSSLSSNLRHERTAEFSIPINFTLHIATSAYQELFCGDTSFCISFISFFISLGLSLWVMNSLAITS